MKLVKHKEYLASNVVNDGLVHAFLKVFSLKKMFVFW